MFDVLKAAISRPKDDDRKTTSGGRRSDETPHDEEHTKDEGHDD